MDRETPLPLFRPLSDNLRSDGDLIFASFNGKRQCVLVSVAVPVIDPDHVAIGEVPIYNVTGFGLLSLHGFRQYATCEGYLVSR